MNKKLTAADIDKIERRTELENIVKKYNLNIKTMGCRLRDLKENIKKELNKINEIIAKELEEKDTNPSISNNSNQNPQENKKEKEEEKKEETKKTINLKDLKIEVTEQIDISDLVIYKNTDLTKVNEFILYTSLDLYPVVCLKNDKDEISGKLYIEKEEERKYIVAPKENIDFSKLEKSNFCEVIFVDNQDTTKGYMIRTSLEVRELEIFKGTLCIDFGTSNTSLGTYIPKKDEIKLVKFKDVLNDNVERETIPTVIYVENCADKNNVIYKFGYEAKKAIKDRDYNFKNTIFYEVKRWLLDIEKEEELVDNELNKVVVKRKEILRAYLDYLLKEASNQLQYKFKKLHFSTPILLKEQYISAIKSILVNYEVMDADKSIDEGVAVIYYDIYENIKNLKKAGEKIEIDESEKVMTLDVGGGTTDVISSTYSLKKDERGTKLKIHTYPENSNSYFGGNNITYRIFQYLKIKIVKYLEDENLAEKIDIDNLIKMSKPDILEYIDKEKKIRKETGEKVDKIYYEFEEEYKKVSEVLPTDFKINEKFKTNKQKDLLKRNFYLLWEAAETIKIEFFKKTEIYLIDFTSEDKESKKIKIPNLDNLLFAIVKNENLEMIQTVPQIAIGINEIQKLIYGDIYRLIRNIFEDKDDIISSYGEVKLSGQTCNITLFQELLKEFIAGRYLRGNTNYEDTNSSQAKLKLNCIRGSVKYTSDIDSGITMPKIYREKAPLKNKIKVERPEIKEVLTEEKSIIQLFGTDAKIIKMSIFDLEDNFIKNEFYNLKEETSGMEWKLEDVVSKVGKYAKNIEIQLKEISYPEVRVVIFVPNDEIAGFEVIELYKTKDNSFKFINSKKFKFEKNIDGSKFFNGEA